MKARFGFGKKLLSVLLCLILITGTAVPAFAMEDYDKEDFYINVAGRMDEIPLDDPTAAIFFLKNAMTTLLKANQTDKALLATKLAEEAKRLEEIQKAQALAEAQANSWTAVAGSYFGAALSVVRGISSVITLVNGTVSMLKTLGIIKTGTDITDSILDGVKSIQLSVDEIDRNVDEIREMLVSEFSELDLKFQEQDYNHYKDDVWAQFYSDAVSPLTALQNEYTDDVNWLLADYISQWQGDENGECPMGLRALYGDDGSGGFMQVFSAKNIGDVGEALPREPGGSIDSVPVSYSVTLPSKYIGSNLDSVTALTSENCIELLTAALENGVYQAAENKELEAYGGFDTVWSYLSEEEKQETAKDFAAELVDALAFACAYNAANERKFASNVKSAYEYFTKWLNGAESLTSPLTAQLKMLSLTHGFEGEITRQAENILLYLMAADMNFSTFTATVLTLSKAHGEADREAVRQQYFTAESSLLKDYTGFITGSPNYCYQTNKVIEYRNALVSSGLSFAYGRPGPLEESIEDYQEIQKYKEYCTSTPWTVYEKDLTYSQDTNTASRQKADSANKLKTGSLSSKELKLIYAMYQSSGSEGTFCDYLAANRVAAASENINEKFISSFNTSALDLNKGVLMKCYLPTGHRSQYVNEGSTYAVSTGISSSLDKNTYSVCDQVTGGVFNTQNGSLDENAVIAARAFYGEEKWTNIDEIDVFSTAEVTHKSKLLSNAEVTQLGIDPSQDERFLVDCLFKSDYGMLIAAETNTYTFPADTVTIKDKYFGGTVNINSLIFEGIPEEIGENAFYGIGSPDERCLLTVPEGFETGSLEEQWHGGYFGNTQVTLVKNDGTGEEKCAAAVSGAALSTVVNPFEAPENRKFAGWSYNEYTGRTADPNSPILPGQTLYAVWDYDHEHDFEISAAAVTAACTEDGQTAERICKICGFKEYSVKIPAFGHSCTFEKQPDGTYLAECSDCSYSAFLHPKTCGTFTVWCEDTANSGISYMTDKYNGNSILINKSGVFVIENNNKNSASAERISVNDGIKASIGLAGVNIAPYARVAAINSGSGTLHITLVDGTENRLTGGGDCPAIQTGGNLVIDGSGALAASAQVNSAIKANGLNTIIKSGSICALCGEYYGINLGGTENNFVISENACVYSGHGFNKTPVNENGEEVYLLCFENSEHKAITVDGRPMPYTTAPNDDNAYIYLTAEEHEITLGGEPLDCEYIDGRYYFEKVCGDFTVTLANLNAVTYSDGLLSVVSPDPVRIRNTSPAVPTTDRIFVKAEIPAEITLEGVNIARTDDSAIKIADNSSGNVKITLADGSVNTITGGSSCAALAKNGRYGTLTIDGKGTLNAAGGFNAAAIGSDNGKIVHGIIINGGIINASATSYRAAAIGSGCVEAAAAPSGDKIYTADGIIINGGTIYASAKSSAAIGGGDNNSVPGKTFCVKDIIINGGTVTAVTEAAAYSIGAGAYTAAENIRINGGIVSAIGTGSPSGQSSGSQGSAVFGGIGANLGTDGLVVEKAASVKSSRELQNPVNGEGSRVYLNTVPVDGRHNISVDGKIFPYANHNGENMLYIYLPRNSSVKSVPILTLEQSKRGIITASIEAPSQGDEVKLSAEANEGYVFKEFTCTPSLVEIKDGIFTMPDYALTVSGVFSRIGTVTIKDCENCTVTPSKSIAETGEKITLRIVPDEGMELESWTVVSENAEITNNTFIMPDEDVIISCVCVPKEHTLTWNVNGNKNTQTLNFGEPVTAPENPAATGYTFDGWSPEIAEYMPDEDIEYTALFTPVTYYAVFEADGKTVSRIPYTVEDTEIPEPYAPDKTGYVSSWADYSLTPGGITVKAEYTPAIYSARFAADGVIVDEIPYTVETVSITPPVIPNKDGFTARWSDYTLCAGGITVNAVYTPVSSAHEHTFASKYSYNDTMHWHAATCEHTDIAKDLGEHTFGDGIKAGSATIYICSECSYVRIITDEVYELRILAVAELEAAAPAPRTEAMQAALDLAEEAVERAATAEEIASAKESGLALIRAAEFAIENTKAIGNCTVDGDIVFITDATLTSDGFNGKYIINKDAVVEYTPSAGELLGTGSKIKVTYFNGKSAEYTLVVFGDVNGDSVCDVLDASHIEMIINEKETGTDAQLYAANGCTSKDMTVLSYQTVLNRALSNN